MNMGSLRAELSFPTSYAAPTELDRHGDGGAAGGHHPDDDDSSDDDDGEELNEDVMILGSTPQGANAGGGAWQRPRGGGAGFGGERFDNGQPALRIQHVRRPLSAGRGGVVQTPCTVARPRAL
jgi:hypothetical protein